MEGLAPAAALPKVSGLSWQGVNYFSTTRQGGVSAGHCATLNLALHVADDPAAVGENRQRLDAELPAEPLWLNQVHGIQVCDADQFPDEVPTADAAITTIKNRVLAIMTADCLPVVIADTQGDALGIAHAGWRGLCNGVLEETLHCLRAKQGDATRWRAWIGPAITQRYFEVGPDVFAAFVEQDGRTRVFFAEKTAGRKWLADLPGLARYRLHQAGVDDVELSGYCTYQQSGEFFSYRRDPASGRIATIAWLGAQA
jgi:YfiH family protein